MSEQIKSAEGITRFLRSKDTSIDQVVEVSYKLLQEELDIYLPNKKSFVLELLCDRLSDVKTKKFRESSSVWGLLYHTWCALDDEPKLRNRIFQNLKFGEALVDALSTFEDDVDFINTLSDIMNATRLASLIGSNTLEYSIDILTRYLHILRNISDKLSESDLKLHIHTISSFYQAVISAEKLNRKSVTKFASSALPSILQLFASKSQQYPELLTIIKKVLLNKEQRENLISNLKELLQSKPSDECLVLYYNILLDAISKDDITTAEQIFTLITEKHPDTAEKLLALLSNLRRTLSQPFLDDIAIKEFNNKTPNWELLSSVVQLDIEIGIKYAKQVLIGLEEQKSSNWLKLGDQLLNCFIRAREFLNFFELWKNVILETNSKIWTSSEFSDLVSSNTYVLSTTEMKTLTESIFTNETNHADYIILNSVVQGLFSTQDVTLVQQSRELLKPTWKITRDDEQLWKLKYQLLCLHEDILNEDELQIVIGETAKLSSINHFYLLFRIREIYEYDFTPVVAKFLKFLQKESKTNPDIFDVIFTRWFVLINTFFQPSEISTIWGIILKNSKLSSRLFDNDYLFEQEKITSAFTTSISESLGSDTPDLSQVEILSKFPIQCYPRRIKHVLLNQLSELLFKSQDQSEIVLATVEHILTTPTFKSKIEIDLDTIFKLVENYPHSDIFTKVWNHHYQQRKESSSSEIISNLAQRCVKQLNKTPKALSASFHISFTILSNSVDLDSTELQESFLNASKSLLNKFISQNSNDKIGDITWLLGSLSELKLSQDDFKSIKPSIQKFASTLTSNSIEIKTQIFKLFCQYFQCDEDDVEYFEALYVVLRQNGGARDELSKSLSVVISKISDDQFKKGLVHLLYSIETDEFVLFNAEILSLYWKFFNREVSESSIKLFVKSISTVLLNFHKFAHTESLVIANQSIRSILLEKTWIISQYGLELVFTLLTRASDSLALKNNEHSESIYQSITITLSTILLFHRFRLSNRHHVLIQLFKSLLLVLTRRSNIAYTLDDPKGKLQYSIKSADSFSRVLSNLCEPPISSKDQQHQNSLITSSSIIKRSLRKYLPVLLCSYIHFSLKFSYDSQIREALLPGVFNIFDVLSQNELVLVSTLLDNAGRTYYRSLYDDYKKTGKWKTD